MTKGGARNIIEGMNWYGFIIACGIVAGVTGAYIVARHRGLEGDIAIDMILFCLPLGILGARVYHVVFDVLAGEEWTFRKFIGLDDGGLAGLAIYGGLFGALIGAGLLHLWKNRKKNPVEKRVSFWQIVDLGFMFIILGQAIGRWGNIANNEGYGGVITDPMWQWKPFGMYKRGQWHYSIPLFESMWDLVGFFILLYLYLGRFKSFDGFVFAGYCIYYGIGRTWIEAIRVDDVLYLGGMRISVFVSVMFIIAGVAIIITHIVRARRAGKKPFLFVEKTKLCNDYYGYDKTKLAHPMPDIVFFKDRKKKKDKEKFYVDESGLAIRVNDDAPPAPTDDAAAAADGENANTVKPEPTPRKKNIDRLSAPEADNDEWDD